MGGTGTFSPLPLACLLDVTRDQVDGAAIDHDKLRLPVWVFWLKEALVADTPDMKVRRDGCEDLQDRERAGMNKQDGTTVLGILFEGDADVADLETVWADPWCLGAHPEVNPGPHFGVVALQNTGEGQLGQKRREWLKLPGQEDLEDSGLRRREGLTWWVRLEVRAGVARHDSGSRRGERDNDPA